MKWSSSMVRHWNTAIRECTRVTSKGRINQLFSPVLNKFLVVNIIYEPDTLILEIFKMTRDTLKSNKLRDNMTNFGNTGFRIYPAYPLSLLATCFSFVVGTMRFAVIAINRVLYYTPVVCFFIEIVVFNVKTSIIKFQIEHNPWKIQSSRRIKSI